MRIPRVPIVNGTKARASKLQFQIGKKGEPKPQDTGSAASASADGPPPAKASFLGRSPRVPPADLARAGAGGDDVSMVASTGPPEEVSKAGVWVDEDDSESGSLTARCRE
jgi:hypothetical protein